MGLRPLLLCIAGFTGVACSLDWGRLDPREASGPAAGGATSSSEGGSTVASGGQAAAGGSGVGGKGCVPMTVTAPPQDVTMQMVLALDRSGSMSTVGWAEAIPALSSYVQSAGAADVDFALNYFPVMDGDFCEVTNYSTPAVPLVNLGSDGGSVAGDLMMGAPGGGTPLGKALEGTLDYVDTIRQAAPAARTLLVVVGDGPNSGCNDDDAAVDALITAAVAQGHRIHFIAVGEPDPAGMTAYVGHAGAAGTPLVDLSTTTDQLGGALAALQLAETPCRFDIPAEVGPPSSWLSVTLASANAEQALAETQDCAQAGDYVITSGGLELCDQPCGKLKESAASVVIETGCD